MDKKSSTLSKMLQVVSLVVIGIGIGWLVGLSVSPVVSIVVTSLTAAAGALLAVLSGSQQPEVQSDTSSEDTFSQMKRRTDALPIAALVLGIICGSAIGLAARNYGWLGTDLDLEIHKWTKYGLDERSVADRLFEAAYPSVGSQETPHAPWVKPEVGVLFGTAADMETACVSLLDLEDDELTRYAKGSSLNGIQILGDAIDDPETLRTILEVICSAL